MAELAGNLSRPGIAGCDGDGAEIDGPNVRSVIGKAQRKFDKRGI